MIDVRSVFAARDAMLADGVIPEHLEHRIRPDILKSWRRSILCGATEPVPVHETSAALGSRTALRAAADPILSKLSLRLSGLDTGVLLADRNAVILRRWVADRGILALMDSINSAVGFNVAEELVGTNGVGSIIEAGHAMQISGPEHLSPALTTFTCVGAPIHNPITRRLDGVITLSCMSGEGHPLLTPLLTSTAQDIEHRMLEQSSRRERLLLDAYMVASKKRGSLIAAVGRDLFLAGPQVTELLRDVDQAALWEYVRTTAGRSAGPRQRRDTFHERFRVVRCDRIESDGEVIGTIVEFDLPRVNPPSSLASAARPSPRELLPGTSAALTQSVAQLTRMARAGHSLLIEGEPGVGKWALARRVLEISDVDPLRTATVDAAASGVGGSAAFIGELRAHLEDRPDALVLRHLESLSDETAAATASLLEAASTPDWAPRVLATLTVAEDDEVAMQPLQRLIDHVAVGRVTIPPMRERREDISEAATALLNRHRGDRDLRWSSAALRALMRAQWPGNLRQLDGAVRGLVSAVTGSEIHPEDLPPELQSHARRELSAMEQLELDAILKALRQHRGNKIAAANAIGISRSTLYRKLRAYRIDPERQYF